MNVIASRMDGVRADGATSGSGRVETWRQGQVGPLSGWAGWVPPEHPDTVTGVAPAAPRTRSPR